MSENSPKPKLLAIALCAVIGFVLALILTRHFYEARADANATAACDISAKFSCSDVARSDFAEPLKGLPLSTLAAGWFLGLALVALMSLRPVMEEEGKRALFVAGCVGLLLSLGYLAVMALKIKSYCLYCFGVDAVSLTIFILALSLKPSSPRGKLAAGPWVAFLGVGLIALIAVAVGFTSFAPAENPLTEGLNLADPVNPSIRSAPSPADSVPEPPVRSTQELLYEAAVNSALSGPVLAVGAGSEFPSAGPASAPVTIVEFADFQCSHCRHGFEELEPLLQHYSGQLRVVFRQFPLDKSCNPAVPRALHDTACEAARVAVCAGDQGKYREAAGALFTHQEELKPGLPLGFVAGLVPDKAKLAACVAAPKTAARVKTDIDEGIKLELHATPTFFVNGRLMKTAPPGALDTAVGMLVNRGGK